MKREEGFGIGRLRNKVTNERKTLQQRLASDLLVLAQRVKHAQQSLDKGESLDAYLIVNFSGMTETIARLNMINDISPYLEDDE